jgi:hypothetical protein
MLAKSLQAAAGNAADANYIESVFSCFLYTSTGAAQTINNGIDLSTEGGLVWFKRRNASSNHRLYDTVRGMTAPVGGAPYLYSNDTAGNLGTGFAGSVVATSTGFDITDGGIGDISDSGGTYVSWTFRKQPKFFDVVTYTGTGANRTVAHNLGAVPGCIIVKRTDTTGAWQVYHRANTANPETDYLVLNSTAATADSDTRWNDTQPTATVFSLGTEATVNASGGTYVAYLFAHNAGGFGLTGTDNVISCGSYVGAGTTEVNVNLGYEPQWLLIKNATQSGDWTQIDTMRGMTVNNGVNRIRPNQSFGEGVTSDALARPTATGFTVGGTAAYNWLTESGQTFIYIAIRRGPMKVPTTGTSVFGLSARTGTGADATVTGSAGVSDAVLVKNRGSAVASLFSSRLTGTGYLVTSTDAAEVAAGTTILQANPWDVMDGVKVGTTSTITNASANTYINYLFDRAPGFFDEVCYTGTGSNRTVAHNLTVVPEMMIVKSRSDADNWPVYHAGNTGSPATQIIYLNVTNATFTNAVWNNTAPTSTVFSLGTTGAVNSSSVTYVAYLFASCPGVSKVGGYTGTGTTQTINCGFTAGARFVLIKRTDDTGDWYVWDSARGIVAGDDPYLLLNSDAAEVTNTDYIDTAATGFEITSTAPAAINASGGTFIFLAVA